MILVVDDDSGVLDVMCAGLVEEGFYAIPASTPQMALAIFGSTAGSFEAVVTDIHFGGGFDGWDLAEEIRAIRADIPIVYVTGGGGLSHEIRPLRRTRRLTKPFDLSALVAALRTFPREGWTGVSAPRMARPVNDA